MHLSFSTLSFEQYDARQLVSFCKRFGYEGLEIRIGAGLWREDISDKTLTEARRIFEDAGIAVIGLGSGLNIRGDEPENTEEFQNMLRIAKGLGTHAIRIFVGTYRHYATDPLLPMDYEAAVRWIQRMCDRSAADGIDILIELHSNYWTGKLVGALIDDVSRPNCKALWDIMNPLCGGETIEQTYAHLKGRIHHLHMKNGIVDPNPAALEFIYTSMRKGTLPLYDIFKLLETDDNQDLFYSLEWVECFKPELKVLKLEDEQVLAEYVQCMKEFEQRLCAEKKEVGWK